MSQNDLGPTSSSLLDRAIAVARDSARVTHPNPRVGCIIVKAGTIIGTGVTSDIPGGEHAEIEALRTARDAGHSVAGADVFVSLEPCCHHGRTPPCTDALIAANVARVVVAMSDPNPAVRGGGLRALNASGITTATGSAAHESAARRVNRSFFSRIERKRRGLG